MARGSFEPASSTLIASLVISISISIVAQPRHQMNEASVVSELEQQLAAAWVRGDRAFIERLLANDWTVIDQSGRTIGKQEVLEETFGSTERRIEAMSVDDVKVRMIGDVAIATGRTRATGSYRGQSASVILRFTDVFHFREGRWQIVASQGTTASE